MRSHPYDIYISQNFKTSSRTILISMVILHDLKSHPPLRRLPPSHQLELRTSLFGQDFQSIDYPPSLFRLFSYSPNRRSPAAP